MKPHLLRRMAMHPACKFLWHRARTIYQDTERGDLFKQASAMAYVTLISLIPSLVALFCLVSLFTPLIGEDSQFIEKLRSFILQNLAANSGEAVVAKLDSMLRELNLASIGWSAFLSVLVTLTLLIKQIEEALNSIWLVRRGRNFFTRFMYFWTFITFGTLLLALAVGMLSGFDITRIFSIQQEAAKEGVVAGRIVAYLTGSIFFFYIYKVVPNCRVTTRNALISALISSVLFAEGGALYGVFVKNATNYKTLYGALAALPLFLTWIYICWVIILLGALISWRLDQGWPSEDSEYTICDAKTPTEELRNAQLKNTLPFLVLIKLYQAFASASGKGMSARTLSDEFKIPVNWILDAMEVLRKLDYIVAAEIDASTTQVEGRSDDELKHFYPTRPASTVNLDQLENDLYRTTDQWIELQLPKGMQEIVRLHSHISRLRAGSSTHQDQHSVAWALSQLGN